MLDNKQLLLMNVAFDFNSGATTLEEVHGLVSFSKKGDKKDKKRIKYKKKCCDKPKHRRCKRCPRNGPRPS